MQTLLDSQKEGIRKLGVLKVGALFKRPGTGKSRTAVELIKSVNDIEQVVWLAPYRSVNPKVQGSGIVDEVNKWGGFSVPVRFVGIESLSNSDRLYLELRSLITSKNTFLVCDESLLIKNSDAKRTKRVIDLGSLCEYKLILNGTPISRNLLDIWAQMEFLSPKILRMGETQYKNTFCEYTKITKRLNGRSYSREFITKYHNIDYLYSLIRPFVYEADLQLPVGQQHLIVNYKVDNDLKADYNKIKSLYLDNEMLMFKNNNIFLEMTMKMQHTYCCSSEKFEIAERIIKEHSADNVVIFCKFIRSREECMKAFPNVTVLSIQSDSQSLNLQSKHVTIEWDKTWDFAKVDQYVHRTYRVGQKHTCYYYYLESDLKLDGLMKSNNIKKKDQLEYFKHITKEELKEVL